jgi:hypothetical protein
MVVACSTSPPQHCHQKRHGASRSTTSAPQQATASPLAPPSWWHQAGNTDGEGGSPRTAMACCGRPQIAQATDVKGAAPAKVVAAIRTIWILEPSSPLPGSGQTKHPHRASPRCRHGVTRSEGRTGRRHGGWPAPASHAVGPERPHPPQPTREERRGARFHLPRGPHGFPAVRSGQCTRGMGRVEGGIS